MLAENVRESAPRAEGPARAAALDEALALAAAARDHALGAPYRDRASEFRAKMLFEDLQRCGEALAELDRVVRGDGPRSLEVERLRMRAHLASGDAEAAARALSALAADPDSNAARIGEYGLAALAFQRGAYEAALKAFSDLAERHPASPWANDALEAALEISSALPEGRSALDLYRAAVAARGRGEEEAAVDSLAALERRHPGSALIPRAVAASTLSQTTNLIWPSGERSQPFTRAEPIFPAPMSPTDDTVLKMQPPARSVLTSREPCALRIPDLRRKPEQRSLVVDDVAYHDGVRQEIRPVVEDFVAGKLPIISNDQVCGGGH